jgi:hypothetical protein
LGKKFKQFLNQQSHFDQTWGKDAKLQGLEPKTTNFSEITL